MRQKIGDLAFERGKILQMAVVASRRALEVFYGHQEPESYLQDFVENDLLRTVIRDCEVFIETRREVDLNELVGQVPIVKSEVESLEINLEESSGGAELTRSRRNALYAAKSVYELLIATTWPRCWSILYSEIDDSLEVEMQLNEGLKYHVLESLEMSANALDWSASQVLTFIENFDKQQ